MTGRAKKSKKANAPNSLPSDLWSFSGLDQQEVQFAFFYEYGRSSKSVCSEVEKMRAARPHPNIWTYCPRNHPLWEILFWLAQQDGFPRTPWLKLKQKAIEQAVLRDAQMRRAIERVNKGQHPFIKLLPGVKATNLPPKKTTSSVTAVEWMCGVLRGSNVDLRPRISMGHIWLGDTMAVRAWQERKAQTLVPPNDCEIKSQPEASVFEFGIPWKLTDGEITEMVSSLIRQSRPEGFKEYAATPFVQRGFESALPFRTTNALDWLVVLRRRNSVKTWREYFRRYGNSDFHRGAERVHMEDCRKAKLILDWFNDGVSLKKKDFK